MNVKRRQAAAFKDKDLSHRGRVHAGKHPLTLRTRQGEGALLSAAADTAGGALEATPGMLSSPAVRLMVCEGLFI